MPARSLREALPRLDSDPALRESLLPHCRLAPGDIWEDPERGHRVACIDARDAAAVARLCSGAAPSLAVLDPPYNLSVGGRRSEALSAEPAADYVASCGEWLKAALLAMAADASIYVFMGADQKRGFQPLPEFILLLREFPELESRSLITLRNQRGYGTQRNWMAVRQELLYYVRGRPRFDPAAEYTEIPRLVAGYYKGEGASRRGNGERMKSPFIRAGNVWVDVQQVFYRMEENVPGCYAQKPLKAVERIIRASSAEGEAALDLFSHSGTGLLACERLGRRCFAADIDPVFCEISIRRLERWRARGRTGWQAESPFPELVRA